MSSCEYMKHEDRPCGASNHHDRIYALEAENAALKADGRWQLGKRQAAEARVAELEDLSRCSVCGKPYPSHFEGGRESGESGSTDATTTRGDPHQLAAANPACLDCGCFHDDSPEAIAICKEAKA